MILPHGIAVAPDAGRDSGATANSVTAPGPALGP